MHPAISLLVYALAVARVTRLVNDDRITEAPRQRFINRAWLRSVKGDRELMRWRIEHRADPPLAVYLITCPWCVSIYLGAIAAPLVWFFGSSPWLLVPAMALAFSQFTGLLAKWGE